MDDDAYINSSIVLMMHSFASSIYLCIPLMFIKKMTEVRFEKLYHTRAKYEINRLFQTLITVGVWVFSVIQSSAITIDPLLGNDFFILDFFLYLPRLVRCRNWWCIFSTRFPPFIESNLTFRPLTPPPFPLPLKLRRQE